VAVWCGGRATIGGDPDGGSLLACDVCGDVATGTVEQYKLQYVCYLLLMRSESLRYFILAISFAPLLGGHL